MNRSAVMASVPRKTAASRRTGAKPGRLNAKGTRASDNRASVPRHRNLFGDVLNPDGVGSSAEPAAVPCRVDVFGEPLDPEEISPRSGPVPSPHLLESSAANPVLAAMVEGMAGSRCAQLTWPAGEPINDVDIASRFGDECARKLGRMLIAAISAGNVDFSETIREAIKKADALFWRHREKPLLERALPIVLEWPQPHPRGGEARRRLGQQLGREVTVNQWKHLGPALGLQGKRGAPAKK